MKKAVVIGGSNGVGLGVTNELIRKGYFVYILDISVPNESSLEDSSQYEYVYFDMLNLDLNDLDYLRDNEEVDTLIITAGFGRVAHFESLSSSEIKRLMTVNATSTIQVLHYFYNRISQLEKDFYTAVMVSIAGSISSPLFSVYSASKAALHRFIESVNVELAMKGTDNRILEVSPGSIKGTRFNGSEQNDLSEIDNVAISIVDNALAKNDLFIPDYDTVYKRVLDNYHADPVEFGKSSYRYKTESGRIDDVAKKDIIGYLSGTFDLFHIGHLKLLEKAKKECDYLVVGVHPDASHKGKETFISFEERLEIVNACQYVDKAVPSTREDSDAWDYYHYDKLFVGSDYKGTERFKHYEKILGEKGVEIVYFPYTKGTSSTQLRKALTKK